MGFGGSKVAAPDPRAKGVAKAAIAAGLDVKTHEDAVTAAFQRWDTDGSGMINKEELKQLLLLLDPTYPVKDIDKLMKSADKDNDSQLSYAEMVNWIFCAPYLEQYFTKSEEIMKANMKDAAKLQKETMKAMEKMMSGDMRAMEKVGTKMAALQKSSQEKIDKELTPIIQKSFAWHDKDGSGIMEVNESIVFFSNYINLCGPYMKAVGELATSQSMGPMGGCELRMDNIKELYDKDIPKKIAAYHEDMENRHKAAFAVIDVNKDGKLQETEVLEALLHGHPKNEEFMRALGIMIDPAEAMAAGMADAMGAIGEGCEQM